MTCCFCRTIISIAIASIGFTCCWELNWCDGLHSKLHNYSNEFQNWSHSNSKFVTIGFKTIISSNL
jgi:hypothetical protein